MSEDRCIICGEIIPEGRQVCPTCEKEKLMKCNYPIWSPICLYHYNGECLREHNYECPALAMNNLSNGEMVQIAEGKKNKPPRYIDANRLIDMAMHEGAYGYVDVHDIYNAPTADVVEIDCAYNKNEDTPSLFWCSNCDWYCSDTTPGDKTDGDDPYSYNYCPNCGRRIRRKADDNQN